MKSVLNLFAILLLLLTSLTSAENCTQEEALSMMSLLTMEEVIINSKDNLANAKPIINIDDNGNYNKTDDYYNAYEDNKFIKDNMEQQVEKVMEMSKGSLLIAEGKYNEACALYKQIANRYGIDLNEVKKHLEIEKTKLQKSNIASVKCTPAESGVAMDKVKEKINSLEPNQTTLLENRLQNFWVANMNIMVLEPSVFCTKLMELLREFEIENNLN
jgi:hypothetical protein